MFDFVITDENLAEILNTVDYELLLENMFSYQKLVNLNVPLERASEDNTRHNNYGVKLMRCVNVPPCSSQMVDYLRMKILDG